MAFDVIVEAVDNAAQILFFSHKALVEQFKFIFAAIFNHILAASWLFNDKLIAIADQFLLNSLHEFGLSLRL